MFVALVRACVLSVMFLALKASFHAKVITLITITDVIANIRKKKHRLSKPEKHPFLNI